MHTDTPPALPNNLDTVSLSLLGPTEGVYFALEGKYLRGISPQEADTATQLDQNTVGNMPAYYE